MRISLEMPDAVFGKLANLADSKGVKVADIVGDAVAAAVGERVVVHRAPALKLTPDVPEKIVAAHGAGMTWQALADRFGVAVSTIYGAVRRETGRRSR